MKWNKTSEKLPPEDTQYLVFDTMFNGFRVLRFNSHLKCWDENERDYYECEIERCSHWMELPEIQD